MVQGLANGFNFMQFPGIDKTEFPWVQDKGFSVDSQIKNSIFCIYPFQFFMPVLRYKIKSVFVVVRIYL